MKRAATRLIAYCLVSVHLLACSAAIESNAYDTSIATPTPTYSCAYYSGYDDLNSCQTASNSNCTFTWESFPSGGVALCYFPPVGYQSCLVTPPTWDWIYTPYSAWCDTGTTSGGNEVFKMTRSVISCSSTLCYCSNAQVTTVTCAGSGAGAGQCGVYSPNPATAAPTPSLCP